MNAPPRSTHDPGTRAPAGRPRRRRAIDTALAAISALVIAAVAAPAASAVGPPFDPATASVFIAHGNPTQLSVAVQTDGQLTFSDVGPNSGFAYNAMAYATSNNYLYAIRNGTRIPARSSRSALTGSPRTPA